MTRDEIVAYALPSSSPREGLEDMLAQQVTAASIAAKVSQVNEAVHRADGVLRICGVIEPASLVLMVAALPAAALTTSINPWLLVCACVMSGLTALLWQYRRHKTLDQITSYEALLQLLQPIAGTDSCQEALKYLEGDAPGVAAWKDIALSEHEQLYHFDVDMMRRLHELEETRAQRKAQHLAKEQRQHLNEEACRKLHGLAPLTVSAAQG